MRVRWTTEAEITHEQNLEYLAEEWTSDVINNYLDLLDSTISKIQTRPEMFPIHNELDRIHKCVLVKQITIYYQIEVDHITLLTFWNNYQNPSKLKL